MEVTVTDLKKRIIDSCLQKGATKLVVVSSVAGVSLPPYLMSNRTNIIAISRRFRGELALLDSGIETELSFKGELFHVVVPWDSIQTIMDINGDTHTFADTIEELHQNLNSIREPREERPPFKPEVIVDNTQELGIKPNNITPPRSGHLRLVN